MAFWVKQLLQTLLMTVVLFAVAFLTRMPALHMSVTYGVHALFAAPFYALAAALFRQITGRVGPAVAGGVVVAAILGAMSPVMALGNGVPPLVCGVVAVAMRGKNDETSSAVLGTVWGALAFPATIAAGMITGGYAASGSAVFGDVMFTVLAGALSALGAMVGTALGARLGTGRTTPGKESGA